MKVIVLTTNDGGDNEIFCGVVSDISKVGNPFQYYVYEVDVDSDFNRMIGYAPAQTFIELSEGVGERMTEIATEMPYRVMNKQRAEDILGKGDVEYFSHSDQLADLHGEHTAEELEAIAWVMRNGR